MRPSTLLRCLILAGLLVAAGAPASDRAFVASLRAGDARRAAGEYGAAATGYAAARERRPASGDAALRLAEAYLGRAETGAALALLWDAGNLDRRRRAAAAGLAGAAYAAGGDTEAAARWWEHALALWPAERRSCLGMAGLLLERGDDASAAGHLRRRLEAAPADADAAYRLGLALLAADPPGAREALRRAGERGLRLLEVVERQPADAGGAAELGLYLLAAGEPEAALRQWEVATTLAPAWAEAQAYRAYTLSLLGRPALDAFRLALQLDGDSAVAHYLYGRYLMAQGAPAPARGEFLAALRADPQNAAVAVELAYAWGEAGNYVEGDLWLGSAVAWAPADAEVRLAQARFYLEREYLVAERGLPAAQAAVRLAPASAEAAEWHGWALWLAGRHDEGLGELSRSVELEPARASARYHLGAALQGAGQEPAAREELERAVDLDPAGRYGQWAAGLLGRP